MPRDIEGPIHKAIITYLNAQLPDAMIHHSPNEGVRGGKRGQLDGVRRKAMGQLAGFPDIMILWRGNMWFFEVKGPNGRLTEAQTITAGIIKTNGGKWAVARSVDDAKRFLDQWRAETVDAASVPLVGVVT